MEELTKEFTADPEKARAFFQSAGIMGADGKLTARYGGTSEPMTGVELIQSAGKAVRQSRETAIAFLQEAGILDAAGGLTEPYRTGDLPAPAAPSAHVCTPPFGGIDLDTWLAAYLAAAETQSKDFFTLRELHTAAGLRPGAANEVAMLAALQRSALVPWRQSCGERLRGWLRQPTSAGQPASESLAPECEPLPLSTHGTQGLPYPASSLPSVDPRAHSVQVPPQPTARQPQTDPRHIAPQVRPCNFSAVESANVAAPAAIYGSQPLPHVPAPSLEDLDARAREAVQASAERAAARHWAFYREGSLDILSRLSCAIAIHKLQAQSALDIPEVRP